MTHSQESGTGGEVSEILFFSAKSKRRPSLIYSMQIIPVCLSIVARRKGVSATRRGGLNWTPISLLVGHPCKLFHTSHPFQGKRVRPSRPSSRKAITSSFCLGYADKLLRIADAVVVPAFVEVASLRISGQLSTMRPVLMVPPMKGIMMAGGFMPCSRYNLRDLKFRVAGIGTPGLSEQRYKTHHRIMSDF